MLGECLFYHCGVSPLLLTMICKSLGTQETSCWTFFRGGMLSRFSVLLLLNIHGSSLSYFLFHEIFDLSVFHFSIFTHCFFFAQQSLNLHTDGTANCVDWKCPWRPCSDFHDRILPWTIIIYKQIFQFNKFNRFHFHKGSFMYKCLKRFCSLTEIWIKVHKLPEMHSSHHITSHVDVEFWDSSQSSTDVTCVQLLVENWDIWVSRTFLCYFNFSVYRWYSSTWSLIYDLNIWWPFFCLENRACRWKKTMVIHPCGSSSEASIC